MSHDHDHDHDHGHDHDDRDEKNGAPDTGFLDLEISKVLYSEAESITREAYRELLKDAAKRRLEERWGDRIAALANLAVDELIDDAEANLEIEAKIAGRTQAREAVEERINAILGHRATADESDASP